jgi:16S rRNA (guanine527-N7)-methyltransferase
MVPTIENSFDLNDEQLRSTIESLPFDLDPEAINKLLAYIGLFISWNDKLNFSRFKTPTKIFSKLILPSLCLASLVGPQGSLLDIGSGPGIPGIPIKIVHKKIDLTIIESSRKALEFLSFVNYKVLDKAVLIKSGRAENLAHEPELREKYLAVVVRALAPIPIVLELASPFLLIDGDLFIHSSFEQSEEDLDYTNVLALNVGMEYRYGSSIGEFVNIEPIHFIKYRKVANTPDIYPRSWKRIKNAPLWK